MKKESQEKVESVNVKAEIPVENSSIGNVRNNVSYSVNDDSTKPNASVKGKQKYYRIIFAERESENESRDIFLCLNGREMLIKRGVEVIIPEGYYDIAKHAVVNSFKMNKLTNRLEPVVYRRFTYSVLGEATEEEYNAFLESCKREKAEIDSAKEV